jgi:hypothetical protein
MPTANKMGQDRIMFIEHKGGENSLTGDARIGRVITDPGYCDKSH